MNIIATALALGLVLGYGQRLQMAGQAAAPRRLPRNLAGKRLQCSSYPSCLLTPQDAPYRSRKGR